MGSNISPSGAAVTLSEVGGNPNKYLSGIKWLTRNDVMNIITSCNNVAMKTYLNSNALKIEWGEFGKNDTFLNASNIFSLNPPNKATVANYNNNFSIGTNNYTSENDNAKLRVRYFDPHGLESNVYSADYNMRIDTFSPGYGSDSLIENFTGEGYRFTKTNVDANLSNNGVIIGNGGWNSTTSIIGLVGGDYSLQFAHKKLLYPYRSYVSTIPVGLNYSGLTENRTFYRLFQGTGPYNGGTITFEGLSNAKNEIINKSNIEVYLHLPGITSYQYGGGFENGSIFQDLGIYQNQPGGCLAYTGGSGSNVDFSFNSNSSILSNYKCFIKIKIKNINVLISKITFSPTYA
jgi:hypothetical protein